MRARAATSSLERAPRAKLNAGTRSSSTVRSASSKEAGGAGVAGSPSPTSARKGATARRARSSSSEEGRGTAGSGANRFTANGREVSDRIFRIASRIASGARYWAANDPRPPAFDTAAVSSGVDGPPAMGARRMG